MNKAPARGYVLMALLLLLASISAALFMHSLSNQTMSMDLRGKQKVQQTLNRAKELLISSALSEDNTPGSMPCPAPTASASSDSCNPTASLMGRFPFKTLAAEQLTDDAGECIWYALSPSFRNSLQTIARSNQKPDQLPINPDNPGNLILKYANGTTQRAIALLIAGRRARDSVEITSTRNPNSGCNEFTAGSPLELSGPVKTGSDWVYTLPSDSDDIVIALTAADLYRPLLRVVLFATRNAPALSDVTLPATLADLRFKNPSSFDQTLFGGSTTSSSSDCPNDAQANREARGWLCWNEWYPHINMDTERTLTLQYPTISTASQFSCRLVLDSVQSKVSCTPALGSE